MIMLERDYPEANSLSILREKVLLNLKRTFLSVMWLYMEPLEEKPTLEGLQRKGFALGTAVPKW